jgi:hypothetical protein
VRKSEKKCEILQKMVKIGEDLGEKWEKMGKNAKNAEHFLVHSW